MGGHHLTVRLCALAVLVLGLSVTSWAQETALLGTVTDDTGAVLPGVTVIALHEATGNSFSSTTSATGSYRFPALRVGTYTLKTQLEGFAPLTQAGIELLAGRTLTVNLKMSLASVAETITVTGETPLIELARSEISGNVDPRQMAQPALTRAELDGAQPAGSRRAGERRGVRSRGEHQRHVPDQRRWTTSHPASGGRRLRPARAQATGAQVSRSGTSTGTSPIPCGLAP